MPEQDIHDFLSPHYQVLPRLAQVPVKSFLSRSDTEAYQYRQCKSLIKENMPPQSKEERLRTPTQLLTSNIFLILASMLRTSGPGDSPHTQHMCSESSPPISVQIGVLSCDMKAVASRRIKEIMSFAKMGNQRRDAVSPPLRSGATPLRSGAPLPIYSFLKEKT